jgi:hypothetical protein
VVASCRPLLSKQRCYDDVADGSNKDDLPVGVPSEKVKSSVTEKPDAAINWSNVRVTRARVTDRKKLSAGFFDCRYRASSPPLALIEASSQGEAAAIAGAIAAASMGW